MSSSFSRTILLTGATGFIGRHVLERLRRIPDTRLVLLSRNPPSVLREGETWITVALDQLTSKIWQREGVGRFDIVFHLGAFTPKRSGNEESVAEIYESNLLGTRALLESMRDAPKKIIFASTLDVYAPQQNGYVLTERSPLLPATIYGASKLFCEHLVRAFAQRRGFGCAILRYGHIYGPGEEAYFKLIPATIQTLLRNEGPIVYGDGSSLRDFLYVEDAVEATLRAGTSEVDTSEAVNIVSGNSTSIREVVETLSMLCEYRGRITYLSDKPAGRSFKFASDRMASVLGRWELVPLREGLRREISYFKGIMERRVKEER